MHGYIIERTINHPNGSSHVERFAFADVSVGDAKLMANMLKYNAEHALGLHKGTAPYSDKEIERIRIRSQAFVQPKKKVA